VLFPAPFIPTSATCIPALIVKLIPDKTFLFWPGYLKDTFLKLVYEYDKDGDHFNDPDLYDETDPEY
jgi:hypothetical protein